MPAAVAAPLIGAGVQGVGSIVGGIKGSNAATNAANIQAQSAKAAMAQIQQALGQVTPGIQTAADQSKADALQAALTSGQNLTGAAATAGANLTGAANSLFNPYVQAGQGAIQNLAGLMAPGGQLTQQFNASMMQQNDPGYAFRMQQAAKALQGSAAARGGALGGGTLSALQGQSQQLASNEYQNAFQRYTQNQNDIYNRLSGLANYGMQGGQQILGANQQAGAWNYGAAGQAGNWLNQGTQYGGTAEQNAATNIANTTMNAYKSIADLMTGGAASQAAGQVGSANAWQGALSGVGNAAGQVGNYYNQQNLLNQVMGNNPNFTPYANANPFNASSWQPNFGNLGSNVPLFVNPAVTIPNISGINQ